MKEINKCLFILFILVLGACPIGTIIDYNNVYYERYVKSYNFYDESFSSYKKGDFLLFARFSHNGYESFDIFMSIYSLTDEIFDYPIKGAELIDVSGKVIFSSEEILNNGLPFIIKEGQYITHIELLKDIPKSDLMDDEYILNVYFSDMLYTYQFFSKKRSYIVMR